MAFKHARAARAALILVSVLSLLLGAQVALARNGVRYDAVTPPPTDATGYSVTLEQCATATVQAERSATFTAQMTATTATQRMAMRIELQQRLRGEVEYHTVLAPGLGVWHSSEAGVQIYKYVKQVTNLDAPAAYRAVVRFRWLGEKERVLKRAESRTPRCLQPTLSSQVTQTPPASTVPLAS
ncbi:MAG TPA: hypothetical protein VK701_00195 [Solirubrobacteraceae bacterium]|nr:hypothetical protein [Solirubrobacteraceae bacterium]